MGRIDYCDDWEDEREMNLAMGRYQGALKKSLEGRPGQNALRRLRTALLAMPDQRLAYGALARDGITCAIGALIAYDHGVISGRSWVEEIDDLEEIDSNRTIYEMVAPSGVSETLAWCLMEVNDEHYTPVLTPQDEVERSRYRAVLAWVNENIKG